MARTASESISRQLESLFQGSSVAGLSDRQLLDRFTAARDPAGDAAFAALVARHGPMVLNISQQLLGDHHHAEDSFQAVFLVLARRASSIRDPDLLGNWLYGVALRTSRCARQQLDRRRKKEEGDAVCHYGSGSSAVAEPIVEPADQTILDREQAEALHREIDRLPNSFRLPVVLCYFEGLTLDEAARRLGWRPGTLRSRLARARDKLRRALTLRGVVLPDAAVAAILESRGANAFVTSTLCNVTTRAAIQFADGKIVCSSASALARAVLRMVFLSQLSAHCDFHDSAGWRSHRARAFWPRCHTTKRKVRPRLFSSRLSPTSRTKRSRNPLPAGCSWSAACSIPRASRCQARS